MIRSSVLARWALALLVVVAGSAHLPAVDLYLTGWDNATQKPVFGKIDSSTGGYTQISSDTGLGFDTATGLAWNPAIGKFNLLTDNGDLRTITTGGVVSSTIGVTRIFATLAYDNASAQMYIADSGSLATLDTTTATSTTIGSTGNSSESGVAFLNGTLYATYARGGGFPTPNYFGTINTATAAVTNLSGDNSFYIGLLLASDGTMIYGYRNGVLYSINPATGAATTLRNVTGSVPSLRTMSIPVAVPEPSAYALATLAAGILAAMGRRCKRSYSNGICTE